MIRTKTRLRVCIILLAINLAFIWGNSLLPGEISGAFSNWVKDLIAPLLGWEEGGPQGGGLMRKIAHFTEFACLGVCFRWFWGMLVTKRLRPFLYVLAGAFFTACIDETIQVFVPDRGPGIKDVALDTLGALVGILILTWIHRRKAKVLEDTKS